MSSPSWLPGSDRRSSPRIGITVEVSMTSDACVFVRLAGDISKGGVFVSSYEARTVGTRLVLELHLPNGVVHARGTIRWLREATDSATPGFGVAFDELPLDARAVLDEFCAERTPLYYDVEDPATSS